MSIFFNWQSACRFLNRKIESRKPLPGSNVVIEKTAAGYRISTTQKGASGGGAYQGFFKVVDMSSPDTENGGIIPVVAIVDGRLPADDRMELDAGIAVINDTVLACPPGEIGLAAGVTYITAEFYLSGDLPVFGGYRTQQGGITAEFDQAGVILAVAEADESSVRIYQQQHGMIYNYLFRGC